MNSGKASLLALATGAALGAASFYGQELVGVFLAPERGLTQPPSEGYERFRRIVDPRTREVKVPGQNLERSR